MRPSAAWTVVLALLIGACGVGVPRPIPGPLSQVASPSPVSTALPRPGTGPAVPPPAPGVYAFAIVEKSQQGEERSEHLDEFGAASEVSPGIFRQRVWHLQTSTRPYHVDLLWRPEATYSLQQSFRLSGLCVFGPPMVVRKYPLKVGSSWSTKTFCANDLPPRRILSGNSRVVRTEELSVAGQKVSTFVIEYTLVLTHFRESEAQLTYAGTEWYSPDHRLEIKQTIDYRIQSGGPSGTYTEELKDLNPSSSPSSSSQPSPSPAPQAPVPKARRAPRP